MELTFLYVHGEVIGYARAGSNIADQLVKRGIDVFDRIQAPELTDAEREKPPANEFERLVGEQSYRPASAPTNVACWVSVPTHAQGWWKGQHTAMLTMWETQQLPPAFRETMHEFDTIIVPSWQNVELFSQYHGNVQFLPLGVDPEVWHYRPVEPPERFFNFLIAGRGPRKGVDIAYRAFRTVFPEPLPGRPVPQLLMKSMKGHGDYYAPNVHHHTGRISAEDEVALYASAHCYIQPSRGEGFGLQPLQAMALGRPTILTNAHGHESFAHLGVGVKAHDAPADYFIYGDAGNWWEPDFDEICEAMWDVYNDYEAHTERAVQAAEEISRNWTWSRTADRFLEILGPHMSLPYTGDGTWTGPERQLFGIITNQDWYGEIAGRSLYFKKGHLYFDYADVKRIFFDAGILDPSCLTGEYSTEEGVFDMNTGLAPQQLPQLDKYFAAKSFCPTCQQQLGTMPRRSDLILEEMDRERSNS